MGLFSEPKQKAPPKPPPKPPKKAAVESQAIPETLVPARSIGNPHGTSNSTSQQRPHNSPSKLAPTRLPPGLVPARNPSSLQTSPPSPGVAGTSKPSAGSSVANSSRTAPAPSGPPAGSDPANSAQKPRPPQQVKRPKQPPSLFIPKKVRFDRSILIMFNYRVRF